MEEQKEFEEKVIKINRVSKKTRGGNRIGFSALVAVGDKKGRIGVGLGKAPDVRSAIQKGVTIAKKRMVAINLAGATIPHEIKVKKGAATVYLKPAPPGSGIIAGGAVRHLAELVGIRDLSAKILGTRNSISNVQATLTAFKELRPAFPGRGEK